MPETDILVAPPDREMQTGAPGLCWLEGCRKRRVIPIAMTTSVQRRALRLLADAQHGRTVANMLAHGFTNALLDRLAGDGLATIQPGTIRTATRRITVIWVVITEAGQQALADKRSVR